MPPVKYKIEVIVAINPNQTPESVLIGLQNAIVEYAGLPKFTEVGFWELEEEGAP